MDESDAPVKTPSEILAEKVVGVLAERELVLADDIQQMSLDLAIGKLRAEDWRVAIEKAIDKGASGE